MDKLEEIRDRINSIDSSIAQLFEKRMMESKAVADYKKANGLSITDSRRESEVMAANSALIEDEVIREYYVNFQQKVMELSKAYQGRMVDGMKIAVRGSEKSLSFAAARKLFPTSQIVVADSYEAAYKLCEDGSCDVAVLPMENNQSGEVGNVTDIMFSGSLYVNQVVELESDGTATRFGVFSRVLAANTGKSKMGRRFILMYTVRNEAGSLAQTLNIIGANGYNMCNLRSHPMKDLMWNYYFLVELEGDVNTAAGKSLLQELGTLCERLKLLGTFTISK